MNPDIRDDHLLSPTKWTARLIIPVLVAAFVILWVFSDRTKELWAWTIKPDMTAIVMGGGYLSGAYFFLRVARGREWHRVAVGFLGTTVFTSVLLAATLLHWDKFNHGHVSFWAWLGLYVVTPLLLPWLWVRNQRTDPRRAEAGEVIMPRGLQLAVGTGGALQLLLAAWMFAAPKQANDVWPWPITPLTARTISAFIAFPAVVWLAFFWEARWSCFRITQQVATVGLLLVGLGAIRAHDDFVGPDWSVMLYAASLVTALVMLVALQLALDRRRPTAG
ncbi:MAG TPA: hypothetical protein VF711_09355 [Acidimicrobiales bacterium]